MAACFAANLSVVEPGMADPPASEVRPAGIRADTENGESFLDTEADLPELQEFMQSGPNDVRDILVLNNGFLIATGAAIIRYQYSDDTPKATSVYTSRNGLPSDNGYLLKRDADGGVWAHCQGGVGYLGPKADRWQDFTEKNGLAPGNATNIALSADGNRVWVASTGGLSTTLVNDRHWQVFRAKNLIDILVHPTEDVVWCRRLIRSRCMCGRHALMSQFDLKSRTWRDIPESGNCAHVAPTPCCFNEGLLWMSGGYDPPMLYDPKKNTTRTWPKEPKWERMKGDHEVVYSDWFGQMVPATGGERGAWFATNAGLWRFDSEQDQWQGHLRNPKPGCGRALLANSHDGKTLYWACKGTVAEYDTRNGQWTDLWRVNDAFPFRLEGRHSLTLSPDGRTLWLIGLGGVVVGELAGKKAVTLGDADQPGLTAAEFVRFDPLKKLALIGTPQGVVCTDYSGKPRFTLSRPAPPILHRVSQIAFAPDGSEVWCLMKDEGGFDMPAAVLQPSRNRWEVVPDPKTSGRFSCVAFSPDGKAVWLSRLEDDEQKVVQRKPGSSEWEPFAARMPEYSIEKLWVSPKGDELWMESGGRGLLRAKLASGEVTQYGGSPDPDVTKLQGLVEDYVSDLVFASRGRIAVCSARGGGKAGITQIDLETGLASHFWTESDIEKLVLSPDDRTVWCLFREPLLWAFDVQTRSWTHKCSEERGMPTMCPQTLECSPDGAFVWLRGAGGVAVYSVREKSWKGFVDKQWSSDFDYAPLRITSDGRHVICGHRQGIAILEIDGGDYRVLSPSDGIQDCLVSHIVPAPRTRDYVCLVAHPQVGGLYYVDVGCHSLRKLKDMRNSMVSAMTVGPDGFLWGAVPGGVFCVNPATGEDRAAMESLQVGEPTTTLLP
jgi:hypothetical protein